MESLPQESPPPPSPRDRSAVTTPTNRDQFRVALASSAGVRTITGIDTVNVRASTTLLDHAAGRGIRQLWIGPALLEELGLPADFPSPPSFRWGMPSEWLAPALAAGWTASTDPAGMAPWVVLNRGDQWVDLVVASWDPSNPFAGAGVDFTGTDLLYALRRFHELVGVRYQRSAGNTGLALMREVHRGGIPLPEAHIPPPALEGDRYGASVESLSWIASNIRRSGFLHAFDLNAQYLAACSSAELGFGEPVRQVAGIDPLDLAVSRPGYYRAAITSPARSFPLPFVADGKHRWYPRPFIDLALELGLEVALLEAWVYPERHRWLEPWYARLRAAREACGPDKPDRIALRAVKAVYTASIGRLAGGWLKGTNADTFRPDWRHHVIARAHCNMARHLERVTGAGASLVALNADTAVFWAQKPDPTAAAAAIGLEVSSQLGKWKHAGSAPTSKLTRGIKSPRARLRDLLAAVGGDA